MKDRAEDVLRMTERIKSAVGKAGGLNAREVAAIVNELGDAELRRIILAQFMVSACAKGDVSEVVAWAVVLSHVEGVRPAPDVQIEAMHLITHH